MAEIELNLKKSGGVPTIEIVIGNALWGTYKFKLWDKDGKNPDIIGSGFSGDGIDDEFKIGAISSLNGRYLSWKMAVSGFEDGENEQYHVTILVLSLIHISEPTRPY